MIGLHLRGASACIIFVLATSSLAAQTTTYTYDGLGQLRGSSVSGGASGGVAAAYRYDAAGNRQAVTVTGVPIRVADPSFEQPGQNGWFQYGPVAPGATFTNGAGIAANGSAWGFAAAPAGSQVAFLQSGSTRAEIGLDVANLVPGQRYTVTFKIARRPGFDTDAVLVSIQGTDLGVYTPQSDAFQDVTTPAFTATAATGTLVLAKNPKAGDTSLGIDAVAISPAPAS